MVSVAEINIFSDFATELIVPILVLKLFDAQTREHTSFELIVPILVLKSIRSYNKPAKHTRINRTHFGIEMFLILYLLFVRAPN